MHHLLDPQAREDLLRQKPMFISFEGGEGVGKSTQIRLLRDFLQDNGASVVMTREPGGCENALLLRKMLVEGEADRWDGLSEALLYSAARNEHLRQVIRPELANGRWVLCDRFADSMRVYQGIARGLADDFLEYINKVVVGNTWPELTFVFDLPVESGLYRARGRQENMFENRFENLHDSFHEKVRQGFLKIAREEPQRCHIIDADGNPEEVFGRVLNQLQQTLQARAA